MQLFARFLGLLILLTLSGCMHKGTNPIDPYEPLNRKIHKFNTFLDRIALKPAARIYKAVLPGRVRKSINNAYNNLALLPTTANDLLQGDRHQAIKDGWRFLINSSFGLAGFFDVADKSF